MGVSKNRGTPKSSILIGFGTIINHPFWGPTPIFWVDTQVVFLYAVWIQRLQRGCRVLPHVSGGTEICCQSSQGAKFWGVIASTFLVLLRGTENNRNW